MAETLVRPAAGRGAESPPMVTGALRRIPAGLILAGAALLLAALMIALLLTPSPDRRDAGGDAVATVTGSSPGQRASVSTTPVTRFPPSAALPVARTPQPLEPNAPRATTSEFIASLGATPTPGGYRVGADPPPAIAKVGIEADDVIVRVNGEPMGDAARDQQVFEAAAIAGFVRFEIVRAGRAMILSYPPE